MFSPREALERLRAGNRRFVSSAGGRSLAGTRKPRARVSEQRPFAVVVGCSDSRVPPEIIFDQGLGDLFVIRVAGHICGPLEIGSIEFAAESLGSRLVVVLGHSDCGAVRATLDSIQQGVEGLTDNLRTIVEAMHSSVAAVVTDANAPHSPGLVERAVVANVQSTMSKIRSESELLDRLTEHDGLSIVGATYSLRTGLVDFLDQGDD